jgi:hypothetical protein
MITGNIRLDITAKVLKNLYFTDYFACYTQTPETQKYFISANSSVWQMFDEESPQWVHNLSKKIPQDFTHYVASVLKIMPGNTIPYHKDKHYWLQKKYGVGETWRYLIFLEDWKAGHYFEIYNQPIVKWKAGDWIKFHRHDWHIAGNMGVEPFYSAQITVK